MSLAEQQQALLDAVLAGAQPLGLRSAGCVAVERGLAAYRSNLRSLSARSLASVFPRLAEHLGEDDFAGLAWSFWRAAPPERGDLACWGGGLSDFLLARAGADSGLPGLTRLEWALHLAERACDAELDGASLGLLGGEALDALRLRLRPGVSLLRLEPEALALLGDPAPLPAVQSVLVWRQDWQARWQPLSPAVAEFVHALLAGADLQSALAAANEKGSGDSADFDFSAWLQDALRHTWLHAVVRRPNSDRIAP